MSLSRPALGWALYDFAASAYATSVATALLPAYFAAVVAPRGLEALGQDIPAVSLWGYASSLAAVLVFLLAPVVGATADAAGRRGRFLACCVLVGGAAVLGLGGVGPGDALRALGLFVLAHVAYNVGNALYDAYLPDLAAMEPTSGGGGRSGRDRLSSLGYAFGYAGGGLNLALCLGLVAGSGQLGLTQEAGVRLGMVLAGLWWLGAGLFSVAGLPSPATRRPWPGFVAAARRGVADTLAAGRTVLARRGARRFLLAFFLYNDGVQTVISMAVIFGKEELGLSDTALLLTLLGIQAIALAGAVGFGRLAGAVGTKAALMLALAVWTGAALYGRTIAGATDYYILGAVIGVALGGSQALSRSLFSGVIPRGESAVYFGFYAVLARLSAVFGPLLFAVVRQMTGSSRPAVLALSVLFLAGMAVLAGLKPEDAHA
uniref:MFS transporter n=1 Tax=Fundidesulfovibrio putealis TaxID=270496 RepID=A0A7C4AHR8_9BACT